MVQLLQNNELGIIAFFMLVILVYFIHGRVKKAFKFLRYLENLCKDYDAFYEHEQFYFNKQSAWNWFYKKAPHIDSLIMSFKKFNLESWFTPKEIDQILEPLKKK